MPEGFIEISGGTRINFDAILKWQPARVPSKTFEQGDIDGVGVVETSGQTLLKHKLTIEIKTDDTYPASGKSALEKWDDLDDFVATEISNTQTLSITFRLDGGDKTITFTGKATKGYTGGFTSGEPNFLTYTLSFATQTKGAIT